MRGQIYFRWGKRTKQREVAVQYIALAYGSVLGRNLRLWDFGCDPPWILVAEPNESNARRALDEALR